MDERALCITVRTPDGRTAETELHLPGTRHTRRLAVGVNPKPAEYDKWFNQLPATPAFTRVFSPHGSGLPAVTGPAITGLFKRGITPHVSYKDDVPTKTIAAYWDAWPTGVPLWWTFRHEGEDMPHDVHVRHWRALRTLRDNHPRAADITLINIHTLYASRWKTTVNWRDWMLPDVADVEGWDCYPPTGYADYEPPESLFGLPLAAARDYGARWSVPELGSTLRGKDTGTRRAAWFRACHDFLAAHGCEAVGLWCSHETAPNGTTLDYRPHDTPTLTAWRDLLTR